MLNRRAVCTLSLIVIVLGCDRRSAETTPPEPGPVTAPTPGQDERELATSPAPAGSQTISFADDAEPEPTTLVQAAPKRPPLPRFRLFGTRENDGPN